MSRLDGLRVGLGVVIDRAVAVCNERADHYARQARKDREADALDRAERNQIRSNEAAACALAISLLASVASDPKGPPDSPWDVKTLEAERE